MASSRITILHRSGGPRPELDAEFKPIHLEYTHVASAVQLALSILESPVGRERLTDLALVLDNSQLSKHFRNDRSRAAQTVSSFLSQIRAEFPIIVIDDDMTNMDALGFHPRGNWDGDLSSFSPRAQNIHLNGPVSLELLQI